MNDVEEQQLKALLLSYEEGYRVKDGLYCCPRCDKPVASVRVTKSDGVLKINCKECEVEIPVEAWKFDTVEREKRLRASLPERVMKKGGA